MQLTYILCAVILFKVWGGGHDSPPLITTLLFCFDDHEIWYSYRTRRVLCNGNTIFVTASQNVIMTLLPVKLQVFSETGALLLTELFDCMPVDDI